MKEVVIIVTMIMKVYCSATILTAQLIPSNCGIRFRRGVRFDHFFKRWRNVTAFVRPLCEPVLIRTHVS